MLILRDLSYTKKHVISSTESGSFYFEHTVTERNQFLDLIRDEDAEKWIVDFLKAQDNIEEVRVNSSERIKWGASPSTVMFSISVDSLFNNYKMAIHLCRFENKEIYPLSELERNHLFAFVEKTANDLNLPVFAM